MSQDRIARVWNASTGTLVQEFGNDAPLQDVVWATNAYLMIGDSNGHGKILSVASGEVLSDLRGHTQYLVNAVASLDGTRVATSSNDGTIRVWRLGVSASVTVSPSTGRARSQRRTTRATCGCGRRMARCSCAPGWQASKR